MSQQPSGTLTGSGSSTSRVGIAVITAVGAVLSLGLGRVIWPDPPGMAPPGNLMPLFVVIGVVESVSFGLGLSFMVYGWQTLRRIGDTRGLTLLTYLSIIWLMVSWWPHDNLHRVLPHGDWVGLLRLEYGFHATLVAAGAVVAWFFLRTVGRRGL